MANITDEGKTKMIPPWVNRWWDLHIIGSYTFNSSSNSCELYNGSVAVCKLTYLCYEKNYRHSNDSYHCHSQFASRILIKFCKMINNSQVGVTASSAKKGSWETRSKGRKVVKKQIKKKIDRDSI